MVRDLRARITGRVIEDVEIYWDRTVGYPSPDRLVSEIQGRPIRGITRRGKFALFDMDEGATFAVHRGMTGSLLLRNRGEADDRFVRARLGLDADVELRLDDARKFGRLYWRKRGETWVPPWEKLGPEPLSDEFQSETFAHRLSKRKAAIKTVLLNQQIVAGLGNIYADESLFLAGIHPTRMAGTLLPAEIERLRTSVQSVLSKAIGGRGTTFSTYRDIDGEPGSNQHALMVFQRQPGPCDRCGGRITRIVVGGRGTHFCIDCQR